MTNNRFQHRQQLVRRDHIANMLLTGHSVYVNGMAYSFDDLLRGKFKGSLCAQLQTVYRNRGLDDSVETQRLNECLESSARALAEFLISIEHSVH